MPDCLHDDCLLRALHVLAHLLLLALWVGFADGGQPRGHERPQKLRQRHVRTGAGLSVSTRKRCGRHACEHDRGACSHHRHDHRGRVAVHNTGSRLRFAALRRARVAVDHTDAGTPAADAESVCGPTSDADAGARPGRHRHRRPRRLGRARSRLLSRWGAESAIGGGDRRFCRNLGLDRTHCRRNRWRVRRFEKDLSGRRG
mmetsp:Transcript_67308/g.170719  ORF Transcript_67308/g.170719 Transcript_67308/m.170719 type:complete len:201 (+) Transcript_67308:3-605(+)